MLYTTKLGTTWFRNEEKGRLVAPWEEFSQWVTSGGGAEIQLANTPHCKKSVNTEEIVIALCKLENEMNPV